MVCNTVFPFVQSALLQMSFARCPWSVSGPLVSGTPSSLDLHQNSSRISQHPPWNMEILIINVYFTFTLSRYSLIFTQNFLVISKRHLLYGQSYQQSWGYRIIFKALQKMTVTTRIAMCQGQTRSRCWEVFSLTRKYVPVICHLKEKQHPVYK